MKLKKLESGRSMVEMLGVLAIIGVLSVGGIAGYSLSMRRHRANGVVDTVAKYALVAYNHCQQKVLNGDTTTVEGCNDGANLIPFSEAGIGNLPAGVSYIGAMSVFSDATQGVDVITMSTRMDDDKLCQAVASVVGSECDSSNGVYMRIKQN